MTSIVVVVSKNKDYVDAELRGIGNAIGLRFFSGYPIGEVFPPTIRLQFNSKFRGGDLFFAGPALIASSAFKDVVESFRGNIEFIPLESCIDKENGVLDGVYFCANILSVCDVFDRDRSQFIDRNGYATRISRIALNLPVLAEPPIYLVDKTIPRVLCVREDLGHALVELNGFNLINPERWTNPALY